MAAGMRPNIYTDLTCVFLVPTFMHLFGERKSFLTAYTLISQTSPPELDSLPVAICHPTQPFVLGLEFSKETELIK